MRAAYAGNKGTKLPFNVPINVNSLTTAQYYQGAVNNQLVPDPVFRDHHGSDKYSFRFDDRSRAVAETVPAIRQRQRDLPK